MKTLFAAGVCVVLAASAARAAEYGWRQDDWSGGPNQSVFTDQGRYLSSSRVDTRSVDGKIRLSFLSDAYTKDPSNPVIPKGGAGEWDEEYIIGYPHMKDGGGYEVLYSGTDSSFVTAIGYADSADGVQWTKHAGNPVIEKSGTESWDQNGVMTCSYFMDGAETGSLLKDGDTYHLFFSGDSVSGINSFGHAASTNLKNWSREKNAVLNPGPAGSWDVGGIESVIALKIGTQFHIWYLARSAGGAVAQIGHATSADGETWVKDPANPALRPGALGTFDDACILSFTMIERQWSGDYLIAYTGSHVGGFGIGIATSPDGSHWVKDPANPIFITGGLNWFSNYIEPRNLAFDGSIYKLQLCGRGPTNLTSTGEVWSEDGISWDVNPLNPLLSPSPGTWDGASTQTGQVFLDGSGLRVFYLGHPPFPCYTVGTATTTPSYNASGTLTSSVFDAGGTVDWKSVKWSEGKPAGTDVTVAVRCGSTATPDASWTAWAQVANGGQNPHADSRYMQYRVTLSTTGSAVSPEVWGIAFNLPIDLKPNKTAFGTTDSLSVLADVEPISTKCYPFIRVTMADGQVRYFERGKGFRKSPTPYLGFSAGAITVGARIVNYPVLSASFNGLTPGVYLLEGGAVNATKTTSVSNLVYVNPVDREVLTVQ